MNNSGKWQIFSKLLLVDWEKKEQISKGAKEKKPRIG
jgi:hypothetical protein